MDLITRLNEPQKLAVTTTEGPVMVMAGAGSGKTAVLTSRIAYLIKELGIPSYNILAVTFTNKAANEMKERVASFIDDEMATKRMWISTFHSFCSRLLRIEMDYLLPFTTNFKILDEEDSLKIVKEVMKELDIDTNDLKPQSVRAAISNKKNIEYYDYPLHCKNDILSIEKKYHETLKENNSLDFDDLILFTIELFKKNKEILKKYQEKFQYIMIDEFQDTNHSQYTLIKLLTNTNNNVFIVGDQDQSIYSFRGADVKNIDSFLEHFKNTKIILLEQNYRSNSLILKLANEIISNNSDRIKKNLFSENKKGYIPTFRMFYAHFDETMFIIDKIKELVLKGYEYKDFAIMYRANYVSRVFEDVLVRYQIPYVMYGGLSFFSRMEIKDVLAYISLICNPNDNISLKRVINVPKRKIGESVINKLKEKAIIYDCSLFEAIDYLKDDTGVYNKLVVFKDLIKELKIMSQGVELPNLLKELLKETQYDKYLESYGDEGLDKIDNVKELKSVIIEAMNFYDGDNISILRQMINDITLRTNMDDANFDDNKVKMMTYHQAKGLEFKVVFMVAMEEGIFPSRNSELLKDLEEERRVCYVGVTRAKERLYLSCAKNRFLFGSNVSSIPSRFIKDCNNVKIPGQAKKDEGSRVVVKKMKEDISRNSEGGYTVGCKVFHEVFLDGIIVGINESLATIAFSQPFGIKKINVDASMLKKK